MIIYLAVKKKKEETALSIIKKEKRGQFASNYSNVRSFVQERTSKMPQDDHVLKLLRTLKLTTINI